MKRALLATHILVELMTCSSKSNHNYACIPSSHHFAGRRPLPNHPSPSPPPLQASYNHPIQICPSPVRPHPLQLDPSYPASFPSRSALPQSDHTFYSQIPPIQPRSPSRSSPPHCASLDLHISGSPQTFVKEKDTSWFVKFCVPWCKHCNKLGTLWEDLGKAVEGEDAIEIGEVDCSLNKEVCTKVDIHSYPTFKLFYDGEEFARYQGQRDVEALKSFVLKEADKAANTNLEEEDKDEL